MKPLKDSPLISVIIRDLEKFILGAFILFAIFTLVTSMLSGGVQIFDYVQQNNADSVHINIIDSSLWIESATIEIQTYNEGFWTAKNVKVEVSLIRDSGDENQKYLPINSDDIIATKSVYVGFIESGDYKTNKVVFHLDETPESAYIQTKVY
jgi:hypothetical protein